MRDRNTLLIVWLAITVLIMALAGPAVAQLPKGRAHFEVTLGYRVDPSFILSRFPVEVRSVPLKPDDEWLQYDSIATSPLRDTTLPLHRPSSIDLSGYMYPAEYIMFGATISMHSNTEPSVDSDQRYQQNQYGTAERGYGTSLRWYQPNIRLFQVMATAALSTPWIKPVSRCHIRLQAGGVFDITGLSLTTEGGYDRWGSDEDWETFSAARLYGHRTFVSLQIGTPIVDPSTILKEFFAYVTYSQPYYSLS